MVLIVFIASLDSKTVNEKLYENITLSPTHITPGLKDLLDKPFFWQWDFTGPGFLSRWRWGLLVDLRLCVIHHQESKLIS